MHNLTVLVPTHGRPTLLKRMLESLKACALPDSFHELVVIENGSRAGAEQVVTGLPEVMRARYMHRERGNKSYALNEALETIADGLVVFFDDDIRVHPEVLTAYAAAAEAYPQGAYFGGSVGIDLQGTLPAWAEAQYPQSVRGYDLSTGGRTATWYLGFNWAAYRQDIGRAGGFNAFLGPGTKTGLADESELQQRLFEHGCDSVDVPEAWVWHYVPAERMTIRWLLQRKYAGGKSLGLLEDKPVWDIVKSLIACVLNAIQGLARVDRAAAFAALTGFIEQTGRLLATLRTSTP